MLTTNRPFNFSAGPGTMPQAVLDQIAADLPCWQGQGLSVMEMSHRSDHFMAIQQQAEQRLRTLLQIPQNFKVLFLQGGGSGANAAVVLNLAKNLPVTIAVTGHWSERSIQEAEKYTQVRTAFQPLTDGYLSIPEFAQWQLDNSSAYLHLCSNETVDGVEFPELPDLAALGLEIPLVVDCSSDIASRVIDWSRVGVAFAGAQKNLGPAGLTIFIVREDLLGQALPICPSVLDFTLQAQHDSMYNTPPTWAIYVAGLMFEWLLEQREGQLQGVAAMQQRNQRKAQRLYQTLDQSGFYRNSVAPAVRSRMNVPFFIHDAKLEPIFIQQAAEHGFLQLAGHKSLGGMRASLYNAMPEQGVIELCNFMQNFEQHYG